MLRVSWTFVARRCSPIWAPCAHASRIARRHRTTGHAAEMAFFAVLTLVPSTIAVGAALGATRSLFGPELAERAEVASVDAVRTLMGPDLALNVIGPFVHVQLTQANGGVAIGSLLVAWWLASRLFDATGHALDACYDVEDGRPTLVSRLLALAFALVSVGLVTATIEMMVAEPFGERTGPGHGLGGLWAFGWQVIRWPLLFAIVVGFLASLYRFAPNVRHSWRDCLPGALVGAGLWIVAAAGFRLSAPLGLNGAAGLANGDPWVTIIGQSVNAVVATMLWAYFASIAILAGGEFNARRLIRRAPDVALDEDEPHFATQPVPVGAAARGDG